MKRLAVLACAAGVLAGCGPDAGEQGRRFILAPAEAEISVPPDSFVLYLDFSAFNEDRSQAVSNAAREIEEFKSTISVMETLRAFSIQTEEAEIATVYDEECEQRRVEEACAIDGHIVSVRALLRGWPAESVGAMLVVASELGVENVRLRSFEVDDIGSFRQQAREIAVHLALLNAQELAEAAGMSTGAIISINDPDAYNELSEFRGREKITVTGSRYAPRVALPLDPEPITIREEAVLRVELLEKVE